jgi:hypothetical protein
MLKVTLQALWQIALEALFRSDEQFCPVRSVIFSYCLQSSMAFRRPIFSFHPPKHLKRHATQDGFCFASE